MQALMLAYVDPGAGSILLQFFIGSIIGAGLFFRNGIARFFTYFRKEES